MANPFLNDKRLQQAATATAGAEGGGWAAPDPGAIVNPPINDGPISSWTARTMTVAGTASATAILLLILLAAAAVGWLAVDEAPSGEVQFPALAIVGLLVGLGVAIVLAFKPLWARFLAPVYAIAQGFLVGAISRAFNEAYDGIVVQAAGATIAVFAVMLFLYRTRIIKVTDRMRRIVIGATLGIAVFYGISLLLNLFGVNVTFLSSASPLSIAFSFLVAGLAAFNLALDFDFIERGANQGMPKQTEWYAAFGVLVTLVWLYLEVLRLLAKLREN